MRGSLCMSRRVGRRPCVNRKLYYQSRNASSIMSIDRLRAAASELKNGFSSLVYFTVSFLCFLISDKFSYFSSTEIFIEKSFCLRSPLFSLSFVDLIWCETFWSYCRRRSMKLTFLSPSSSSSPLCRVRCDANSEEIRWRERMPLRFFPRRTLALFPIRILANISIKIPASFPF